MDAPLFIPPAPDPKPPLRALIGGLTAKRRDLLALMPDTAYRMEIGSMGLSRRGIVLVNRPDLVREVLVDRTDEFAKNDLFTGALAPLVGDGVFISHGETWQRQRAMVEPGFRHLHTGRAFDRMVGACMDCEARLTALAAKGETFSLDAEMTRLSADIIYRVIFSQPLGGDVATAMFAAFERFQSHVANVNLTQFLFGKAFAVVNQPPEAMAAAGEIRTLLTQLVAARMQDGEQSDDLLGAVLEARDTATGSAFTLAEVVDQIAVFFLAGHETTATTLTWIFFLIAGMPDERLRLIEEIEAICGADAEPQPDHIKRLARCRMVINEALRLYPPGAFLPRVALQSTRLGGRHLRRGTMVLISPWIIHRHGGWWQEPNRFQPERFEKQAMRSIPQGAFLPFGLGPRACIGGAFSMAEAALVLARLLPRFSLTVENASDIAPSVHLTLRPNVPVRVRATKMF